MIAAEFPDASSVEITKKLEELWQQLPTEHTNKYHVMAASEGFQNQLRAMGFQNQQRAVGVQNQQRALNHTPAKQQQNNQNVDTDSTRHEFEQKRSTPVMGGKLHPIPTYPPHTPVTQEDSEKSGNDSDDNSLASFDDHSNYSLDISDMVRETMTYNNTPENKKILSRNLQNKKKRQSRANKNKKSQAASDSRETAEATSYLNQLMMPIEKKPVEQLQDLSFTYGNLMSAAPEETPDVRELDSYLSGDNTFISDKDLQLFSGGVDETGIQANVEINCAKKRKVNSTTKKSKNKPKQTDNAPPLPSFGKAFSALQEDTTSLLSSNPTNGDTNGTNSGTVAKEIVRDQNEPLPSNTPAIIETIVKEPDEMEHSQSHSLNEEPQAPINDDVLSTQKEWINDFLKGYGCDSSQSQSEPEYNLDQNQLSQILEYLSHGFDEVNNEHLHSEASANDIHNPIHYPNPEGQYEIMPSASNDGYEGIGLENQGLALPLPDDSSETNSYGRESSGYDQCQMQQVEDNRLDTEKTEDLYATNVEVTDHITDDENNVKFNDGDKGHIEELYRDEVIQEGCQQFDTEQQCLELHNSDFPHVDTQRSNDTIECSTAVSRAENFVKYSGYSDVIEDPDTTIHNSTCNEIEYCPIVGPMEITSQTSISLDIGNDEDSRDEAQKTLSANACITDSCSTITEKEEIIENGDVKSVIDDSLASEIQHDKEKCSVESIEPTSEVADIESTDETLIEPRISYEVNETEDDEKELKSNEEHTTIDLEHESLGNAHSADDCNVISEEQEQLHDDSNAGTDANTHAAIDTIEEDVIEESRSESHPDTEMSEPCPPDSLQVESENESENEVLQPPVLTVYSSCGRKRNKKVSARRKLRHSSRQH